MNSLISFEHYEILVYNGFWHPKQFCDFRQSLELSEFSFLCRMSSSTLAIICDMLPGRGVVPAVEKPAQVSSVIFLWFLLLFHSMSCPILLLRNQSKIFLPNNQTNLLFALSEKLLKQEENIEYRKLCSHTLFHPNILCVFTNESNYIIAIKHARRKPVSYSNWDDYERV